MKQFNIQKPLKLFLDTADLFVMKHTYSCVFSIVIIQLSEEKVFMACSRDPMFGS